MRLLLTLLATESLIQTDQSFLNNLVQKSPLEDLVFTVMLFFFLQKILKKRANPKPHRVAVKKGERQKKTVWLQI